MDATTWPVIDGEMASRIRAFEWDTTPLGPIDLWPGELRGVVEVMLGSDHIASIACGPERRLLYNDAAACLYGDQHPGALGQPLAATFRHFPSVAPLYDRAFAGEPIHVGAQPLPVGTDRIDVFDAYLTPIRAPNQEVAWVFMTGFEIGDRLAAESALRARESALQRQMHAATAEIHSLSRRLLRVQEAERRFLARELHDEIGQILTGIMFHLASPTGLEAARQATAELLDRVRKLSLNLRPAVLDRYGLLEALQWHIGRYQDETRIAVNLRGKEIEPRLDHEMEMALFRIVQESMTNVARHAQATRISVVLKTDAESVSVTVTDDGVGFDPSISTPTTGLSAMRERMALLGGTLEVTSRPGYGSTIVAIIPIRIPDEDS